MQGILVVYENPLCMENHANLYPEIMTEKMK